MSAADTSSAIPLLVCHCFCHGSCASTGLLRNRGTGRDAARNADGMFLFISYEKETDERRHQPWLPCKKAHMHTRSVRAASSATQPHTVSNCPTGICTVTRPLKQPHVLYLIRLSYCTVQGEVGKVIRTVLVLTVTHVSRHQHPHHSCDLG